MDIDELVVIVERHNLNLNNFDVVLIGDGSGTIENFPAGWAVNIFSREGEVWENYELFGGISSGTNNFAELEAYVQGLNWIFNQFSGQKMRILIVSDSQITVNCGCGQFERRANLPLWGSVDWFTRYGYEMTWKHILRGTNNFNVKADARARSVRAVLKVLSNEKNHV